MTIKAYLKRIITEREKAQKKEKALTIPAAREADPNGQSGASVDAPPSEVHRPSDAASVSRETSAKPTTELSESAKENETLPTEAQKDVPQQSIEVNTLSLLDRTRAKPFLGHRRSSPRGVFSSADTSGGRRPGAAHITS